MNKIKLNTGKLVGEKYFTDTLSDLLKEKWTQKKIHELETDHLLCMLTFETISAVTSTEFYQSDKGNIVSAEAYEKYIKH